MTLRDEQKSQLREPQRFIPKYGNRIFLWKREWKVIQIEDIKERKNNRSQTRLTNYVFEMTNLLNT